MKFSRYVGTVAMSPEVRRIAALPREVWEERPDLPDLIVKWTERLKTPTGTMTLLPQQAITCEYLSTIHGALIPIPVGGGKTLISYLAGTVIPDRRKILILVPKRLMDKTQRDFKTLARHFVFPPGEVHVLNYEMLSTKRCQQFLNEYKPDLICADECDALKDPTRGRTKRVIDYLCDNPDCVFVGLSGTILNKSLMDYHHLLMMSLGADNMPLPVDHVEASTWSYAVDKDPMVRYAPGALVELESDCPRRPDITETRGIIERRIHQTPGVVRMITSSCAASIYLDVVSPKLPSVLSDTIKRCLQMDCDPDGQEETPSGLMQHAKTLSRGFYYRPNPEPGIGYRNARRDWARFAREVLLEERPGLDTEGLVKDAVRRGKLQDHGLLERWSAHRKDYQGSKETVWLHKEHILDVVRPLIKDPCLVWVHYTALGDHLEEALGLTRYRNGLDRRGNNILDARPGSSSVVSVKSASVGLNLQHLWHRNLLLDPMASGGGYEQLLGRTHRLGQESEVVYCTIYTGHPLVDKQLDSAFESARQIQETTKVPQKLLMADL